MADLHVKKYSDLNESTPYIAFGNQVVLDEQFKIDTTNRYIFRASKFHLPSGGDLVLYGGLMEGNGIYIPFKGMLAGQWIYTSPMVKVLTSHDFGGALGVVTSTVNPVFWYASGIRVDV